MNDNPLHQLAFLFAGLSLVAVGGANALVPEIHRQVVDVLAWMDDPTFARLFAIAQTAPGPNVMLASIIGWQVAGTWGLGVATAAIITPSSLLALAAGRGLRRWSEQAAVRRLTLALVPIALGLMLASGIVAGLAADAGIIGYAITAVAALVTFRTKLNPLIPMAAGTVVYVGAWATGWA